MANHSRASVWLTVILVVSTICPAVSAAEDVPPSWGDLAPGPHAVGFKVFFEEDRSRGYWPLRDYRGEERDGPLYRPMQISVWYPAVSGDDDAESLRLRDYVDLQATALGEPFRAELEGEVRRELREEMLGRFFPPDGPDDDQLRAILDQPAFAMRDAAAAGGSFPLVIHSGFGPFSQSVLLEYLASHGYVVVTTHMLGSGPAWFHRGSGTLEWWEETARDIGYLRAFAARFPSADPRRTGVVGMTASAALLDQIDSMQLSAIIGTDAMYRDLLRDAAGYETGRIRIPILDIVSKGNTRNEEMLGSLPFAERWIVRLDEVEHPDFYQFKRLVNRAHALEHDGYETVAKLARQFLDAQLKAGPEGDAARWSESSIREVAEGAVSITHLEGEPPIPTEHELLLLVRQGRIEDATTAWRDAADRGHGQFFDADAMRSSAIFRLYDDGDAAGAAAALEVLVEAYPDDADGWRFLARARLASGDVAGAKTALDRAAEAAEKLPERERTRVLGQIERDRSRLEE